MHRALHFPKMKRHRGESAKTLIGALSSFRELGEMSPHKRASRQKYLFCTKSLR